MSLPNLFTIFFIGVYLGFFIYRGIFYIKLKNLKDLIYCIVVLSTTVWLFSKTLLVEISPDIALQSNMVNISVFFTVLFTNFFAYYFIAPKKVKLIVLLFCLFNVIPCFISILNSGSPRLASIIYIALSAPFIIFSPIYLTILFIKNRYYKVKAKVEAYSSIIIFGVAFSTYPFLSLLGFSTLVQVLTAGIGLLIMIVLSMSALTQDYKETNEKLSKTVAEREKEIAKRTEELNKANSNLRFINAQIVHDVKQPLTTILNIGHSSINDSDEKDKLLNNVEIIDSMMNALRDVIRIENNKEQYCHDTVLDLTGIAVQIIDNYMREAPKKHIRLERSIAANVKVEADFNAIRCILDNLLSNALKYTGEHGKIKVNIIKEEETVKIDVVDSGIGMTTEECGRVFDKFSRFDSSTTDGLGLGLYLVKNAVDSLGGIIEVESSPGEGSRFCVSLDMYMSNEQAVEQDNIESSFNIPVFKVGPQDNSKSKTLLVVEDNKAMLSNLNEWLSKSYNLIFATNGKEALKRLEEYGQIPDLIITDIVMPEMDGYQLLANLPELYKAVPIIVQSAIDDELAEIKIKKLGANNFLVKPYVKENLLVTIENLLVDSSIDSNSHIISYRLELISKEYEISERQKETLYYKLMEYSNIDISEKMGISRQEVYNKVSKVKQVINSRREKVGKEPIKEFAELLNDYHS